MTLFKLGRHLTEVAFALAVASILMGCSLYPDVNTDPAKTIRLLFAKMLLIARNPIQNQDQAPT